MLTAFVVTFVALIFVQTILFSKLSEHRTDIPRGENPGAGPSWSWQANVFLHAKYDERGRRLKRWVLALTALQAALVLAAVILQP